MQIQVNASQLSVAEKAQILYRHAKSARLSKDAIDLLRKNATSIVESAHFTPLRIHRLISEQMPHVMSAAPQRRRETLRLMIEEGLQRPSSAMRTSFNVLSEESRTLLIAMLNGSNQRMSLDELDQIRVRVIGAPPSESTERIANLLDDHFIRIRRPQQLA
jgi:hypothetical protein